MELLVCSHSYTEINSITPALMMIIMVVSGAQRQRIILQHGEYAQVGADFLIESQMADKPNSDKNVVDNTKQAMTNPLCILVEYSSLLLPVFGPNLRLGFVLSIHLLTLIDSSEEIHCIK